MSSTTLDRYVEKRVKGKDIDAEGIEGKGGVHKVRDGRYPTLRPGSGEHAMSREANTEKPTQRSQHREIRTCSEMSR